MVSWIRKWQRKRWNRAEFPAAWSDILRRNAEYYAALSPEHRSIVQSTIQILVREKYWEGCGGLSVTDEMKVTIAAHASRLTLGLPNKYFDRVKTILIYPTAYVAPTHDVIGAGVVVHGESRRLGEAWSGGPVVLSWSDALAGARKQYAGSNVIVHEFAHQLDAENGANTDGVPVIESHHFAKEWLAVMDRQFQALCVACDRGERGVIDCYGAENRAEFFAVVTEAFFENPLPLMLSHPELYSVLRGFYQQHPAVQVS